MFKTPGDNIESNMQLFVRSLEHESNGLFKFIIVEDEEGGSGFEDKNTTEEENQNLITWDEDGESIYEFPVHTHDSFVESQELSSDMGSSQQQMMMSKQFAAQSVTDSGGSVIAESIFNDIVDKEVIVSTDTTTTTAPQITTSVPSQMPGWESFGQIDGNEDLDFDRSGGASLKVPPTPEEIANEGKSSDEWNSNEKDAEQANAIFTSTNSEYDITGKLKNIKGMFDKVGTTKSTQTKITKDDGTTETYEIRQTTDETWGLLFITNTITMTGIAGIKPGDLWTTSYLPKKFKENAHFWTTNVSQTIDSSGWKTTLTGRVNFRLQKVQK